MGFPVVWEMLPLAMERDSGSEKKNLNNEKNPNSEAGILNLFYIRCCMVACFNTATSSQFNTFKTYHSDEIKVLFR